jgi:transcriptional regulator with XRE-family HTH domain
MDNVKKLGEKIKQKREEKGWSMEQLISELAREGFELNKSSLYRIENGERQKVDTMLMIKLSNIFNYNFFEELGLRVTTLPKAVMNSISVFKNIDLKHRFKSEFGDNTTTTAITISSKEAMPPTILENDQVVLEDTKKLQVGDIVLVRNYTTNSQFVRRFEGKVDSSYLFSNDGSRYDKEKMDDVTIVGKIQSYKRENMALPFNPGTFAYESLNFEEKIAVDTVISILKKNKK